MIKKTRIDNKKIAIIFIFLLTVLILLTKFVFFIIKSSDINIVLISIDTLARDHMGIYGYPKDTTPNIDLWAKNAVVFKNATTMIPMTHPSFASLMTGRTPFETRIESNGDAGLSSNMKSLAAILSEYGYKTSAFVSNEAGLDRGFSEFNTFFFKYYYFSDNGKVVTTQTDQNKYEAFINSAVNWIAKNKNNKFFTWIHLMDVHAPYFPPEDLRCKFNAKYCPKVLGKSLDELESLRVEYQLCQDKPVPNDRIELIETLYDGGIASADRLAGNIFKVLKKEGLDKKTIVIVYGDHGEGFDHDYYFNHRDVLYNSAINIPLIIKDPRVVFGKNVEENVQNIDILPTILDLLRIPIEDPKLSGVSFSNEFYPFPFSLIKAPKNKYHYYANNIMSKFAISDGHYKYIYSLPTTCLNKEQTEELYDIQKDQQEKINLAESKNEILNYLKNKLLNYLSIYNLPLYTSRNDKSQKNFEQGAESVKNINELKSLQY